MTEQRRNARVPLEVEVTLQSEHNFFTGLTNNVSEGGIFVATHAPPPIGTEVGVELLLAGSRFPLQGVVQWVREAIIASAEAPAGCGVRWQTLADGVLEAIKRFVEVRQTDFYEGE
jgi:uncharacterized protein (TIGR02266 family)